MTKHRVLELKFPSGAQTKYHRDGWWTATHGREGRVTMVAILADVHWTHEDADKVVGWKIYVSPRPLAFKTYRGKAKTLKAAKEKIREIIRRDGRNGDRLRAMAKAKGGR
jgi:hypothetical protein